MHRLLCGVLAAASLAACAQRPETITARFTSTASYRNMDCSVLNEERRRLAAELQRVVELQRDNANADAVSMTVGLVVFTPVLLALAATTDRRTQISEMLGERDAMETVARQKGCTQPAGARPRIWEFVPW
jgi:hypothetical protein